MDARSCSPVALLLLLACADTSSAPLAAPRGGASSGGSGGSAGGVGSPDDGGSAFEASAPARDSGPTGDAAADSPPALGPVIAYASGYAPGLARFAYDPHSGALSSATTTTAFGGSPSFLAVDRAAAHLYAVDEATAGRVGAYAIDPAAGALTFQNAVSSGGNGPAYVGLDRAGRFVLAANYGDGTVSVLPVKSDGSLGAAVDTQTAGANAHMIAADLSNRFVFVPCKGADYVAQYLFDAASGKLTPNSPAHVATASGAGPRHIAFHPNGKLAYVIQENASAITAYALDSVQGTLSELQTVSTLPAGFAGTNTGAEIAVHPSGKWVLGSNRGDDSVVVFSVDAATGKLAFVARAASGGATPRDFAVDPAGAFVLVANQGSGNVVSLAFDAASGALTTTGLSTPVASATFIGFARLPAR